MELMRDTLQQRGFIASRIRLLADGVQHAGLPTRSNILQALDDLIQASGPGDMVFLHFSGHGSMEPGSPGEGPSPIFLPIDIGRWDGGFGRVDNAITRADLRERVDRIAERGAFVWGVFDTCHAATLVRNPGQGSVSARFVQPASLGVPQGVISRDIPTQALLPSRPTPTGGRAGTVFFYASQAGESAVELPLSQGNGPARRHGLFSFHVATALQGRVPMSYRQLGQSILVSYAANAQAYSTPMFTGDALDHLVLGQRALPVRQWPLRTDGGLHVEAGTLSGLSPGALLAVVGSPTAADHTAVGHLRVVTADPGRATLEPVADAGRVAIDGTVLHAGHYLRLVRPSDFALRVAYASAGCTGACKLTPAVDGLRLKGIQGVDVQWVSARENADVVVRPGKGRVDLVEKGLQPGTGRGGLAPGFDLDPGLGVDALTVRLGHALHAVARARNLVELAAQIAGQPPTTGLSVAAQRTAGRGQFIDLRTDTVPWVKTGDAIAVSLGNLGPHALDVTVLHLDAHHGLHVLFPGPMGESNRLPAGTSRRLRQLVIKPPAGLGRLLIIARRAVPGAERSDFSFLAERALIRTRAGSHLELEAFVDAAFAEYRRQGVQHPRPLRGAIDMQVYMFDVQTSRRTQ